MENKGSHKNILKSIKASFKTRAMNYQTKINLNSQFLKQPETLMSAKKV